MVQVLEAGTPKRPTFAQKLNIGVGRGLEMGTQMMQEHKKGKALEKLGYGDLSGLDPDLQKIIIGERLKGQTTNQKNLSELENNQKILRGLEKHRGLAPGSLSAYESDPKLAEKISEPKKTEKVKTSPFEEKSNKQKKAVKDLLRKSGQFKTEEELEEASESYDLATAKALWQDSKKPKEKSEATKLLEKETAKGYIAAKNELPKLEATLSNINHLRNLGKNLEGVGGFLKSAFNTSTAAEYNSTASTLLEPIIKIYNPTGAVPQAKLNWITEQFKPHAGELASTQEGKLITIERIAMQAMQRAEQKIKLFEDFNGEPPESEVLKFDNDSAKMLNDFVDDKQYIEKLKEELPKGMILMLDAQGKPLHVDPNLKLPDGTSGIEYAIKNGARKIE